MRRSRSDATDSSRGAALVEAAIMMPVLLTLLFAIFEFGTAWSASSDVANNLRSSAISSVRSDNARLTDYQTILRVEGSLGVSNLNDVNWLMIYRTSSTDGQPTAACAAAAASLVSGTASVANRCVIYSGAVLPTLSAADFDHMQCTGDVDQNFCPTTRNANFAEGDRLGVALSVDHDWTTRFFPGQGVTIVEHAVAAIPREIPLS